MENLDKYLTKKNLIILLILILSITVITWLILPKVLTVLHQNINPHSEQEIKPEGELVEKFAEQENKQAIQEENRNDKNLPFVDPKTGMLVDGPGFESGEIEGVTQESLSTIPSNYYFIDDGAGGEMSIQHNLCSKSCCSEQWPTPFKQKYDPYVCGNKDKFVGSNIFCNNTFQDSGCLCLTKKQSSFLNNRGGNGREWF